MNIVTTVLVLVFIVILVGIGARCHVALSRGHETFEAVGLKVGRALTWFVAVVLILILVNGYWFRVPNPFGPPRATFTGEIYSRPAESPNPLVIPPTNADPAEAARHEQELLRQAKEQQAEQLKPKQ